MTEQEYVISNFDRCFSGFKGKRILIHGSRNYAQAIIENFQEEYHFFGVLSHDRLSEKEFCSLPVFQREDIAMIKPDLILLTERVKYAQAVYEELSDQCIQEGIALYDMYGLDECEMHSQIASCLWQNAAGWKQLVKDYSLVVFEVVDTVFLLDYEKGVLTIKPVMKRLICWIRENGRRLLFSLRKSFPEEQQIQALKNNLGAYFDENDLIRREGEDLSFRRIREMNPEDRILYIGHSLVNECILPRYYGIDTYMFVDVTYYDPRIPVACPDQTEYVYDPDQQEQIRKAVAGADIVSFDIFDTILLRKTLYPSDVSELMEQMIPELAESDFSRVRIQIERSLKHPTIYDIYRELQYYYGWDGKTTEKYMTLETETEKKLIFSRKETVELFDFAIHAGKEVILTSDMYLPKNMLDEILGSNGITGYQQIYVSCEHKKSKNGGLFDIIRNLEGEDKKILHIGDNPDADIKAAEKSGIRAVHIPSALELAVCHGWEDCIRTAENLSERLVVGMAVSRIFRDPFQNFNIKDMEPDRRLRRFGAGVAGPLAVGYMTRLLEKLESDKTYNAVLFLARDGWLFKKIYDHLKKKMELPPGIYYYCSRKACFFCVADDLDYVEKAISTGEYHSLSMKGILSRIYGIPCHKISPEAEQETYEQNILRHMDYIKERAEKYRKAYRYYSEKEGLKENGKYLLVDFITVGTIQEFLSFLPYRFRGLYFGSHEPEQDDCPDMDYYIRGENDTLLRNYIELESFFTSPEPSVDHIEEDGKICFAGEKRTKADVENLETVLLEAQRFANEFFDLACCRETIRPIVVEEIFAADGFHYVQRTAFDDWAEVEIMKRDWNSGNN